MSSSTDTLVSRIAKGLMFLLFALAAIIVPIWLIGRFEKADRNNKIPGILFILLLLIIGMWIDHVLWH